MSHRFRARYDGRVLVPEGPVELPINHPLELAVVNEDEPAAEAPPRSPEEWLAAFRRFAGSISAPPIPNEALRRENLYDERT